MSLKYALISGLLDQDDLTATSKVDQSCNSLNSIKEQSTSSETLTNNVNEEEGTVSIVKYSYIICDNNRVEEDIRDIIRFLDRYDF